MQIRTAFWGSSIGVIMYMQSYLLYEISSEYQLRLTIQQAIVLDQTYNWSTYNADMISLVISAKIDKKYKYYQEVIDSY